MESNKLSTLEQIILYWVSYDHENTGSIVKNVSDDYKTEVTELEIQTILINLRNKGLVDSYVYNSEKKKPEITTHVFHGLQRNVWWYITDKGKELLS